MDVDGTIDSQGLLWALALLGLRTVRCQLPTLWVFVEVLSLLVLGSGLALEGIHVLGLLARCMHCAHHAYQLGCCAVCGEVHVTTVVPVSYCAC